MIFLPKSVKRGILSMRGTSMVTIKQGSRMPGGKSPLCNLQSTILLFQHHNFLSRCGIFVQLRYFGQILVTPQVLLTLRYLENRHRISCILSSTLAFDYPYELCYFIPIDFFIYAQSKEKLVPSSAFQYEELISQTLK